LPNVPVVPQYGWLEIHDIAFSSSQFSFFKSCPGPEFSAVEKAKMRRANGKICAAKRYLTSANIFLVPRPGTSDYPISLNCIDLP
jgi:hypothetical protein